MSTKVYIATSFDGLIADEDGGLDWLNNFPSPSGSDGGFSRFMDSIDAVVMGRKTFEKVLSFGIPWPYRKKVFVLSNTLQAIDNHLIGKVELTRGEPESIIKKLNQDGYKNLYIDGGQTIQSFLQKNLIDEMIISRAPLILGTGISLLPPDLKINLKLLSSVILDNGMVQSHYKIVK